MPERPLPYERGKQILKTLAEHGPLSRRALEFILYPRINIRRLQDSLSRLYERGLVTKKYDRIFNNAGVYYQIARGPMPRRTVANIIGISPDRLDVPGPRHQALIHWEECAIWAEHFKREFPKAQVYRETQFDDEPLIKNILLNKDEPDDSVPDLMILAPGRQPEETIRVAIEIEKNRKSSKRIHNKLKKYANATRLDGVIYICDHDATEQAMSVVYKSKVLDRALRVNHYGEFFLMFTPGLDHPLWGATLRNFKRARMPLEDWINTLIGTHQHERRNSMFTTFS
jgi:hypothetical protein